MMVLRRVLPLLTGLSLTVGLGALAWASLTSVGQGSGSAVSSTLQPVVVVALSGGDVPSSELQPGGQADVILRISNPNPYPVTLASVSSNGAITASGGIGTCPTSGVTFANATGLSSPIAPSGTTLVDLPDAASMSTDSSSGCQGATFSIPVSIVVHAQ